MLLYGLYVATLSMSISSPLSHWRSQIAGRYKRRHPVTHFKRVIVLVEIVIITDRFQGTRLIWLNSGSLKEVTQIINFIKVPNCRENAIKGI